MLGCATRANVCLALPAVATARSAPGVEAAAPAGGAISALSSTHEPAVDPGFRQPVYVTFGADELLEALCDDGCGLDGCWAAGCWVEG